MAGLFGADIGAGSPDMNKSGRWAGLILCTAVLFLFGCRHLLQHQAESGGRVSLNDEVAADFLRWEAMLYGKETNGISVFFVTIDGRKPGPELRGRYRGALVPLKSADECRRTVSGVFDRAGQGKGIFFDIRNIQMRVEKTEMLPQIEVDVYWSEGDATGWVYVMKRNMDGQWEPFRMIRVWDSGSQMKPL